MVILIIPPPELISHTTKKILQFFKRKKRTPSETDSLLDEKPQMDPLHKRIYFESVMEQAGFVPPKYFSKHHRSMIEQHHQKPY